VQILAAQKDSLPKSATGKAANYALALWNKLTQFLQYPELELSNNLAENSMRLIAIGRKNWIHIGSAQAGPKIAAILSVVESCRRIKIPVRDYFAAVLPGLNNLSIRHMADLNSRSPTRVEATSGRATLVFVEFTLRKMARTRAESSRVLNGFGR
jgi:hypothetical protein